MAIPGHPEEQTEITSYAGPSPMVMGQMGGHPLVVSDPKGAWTYMVNPAVWQCWQTGGIPVPALAKAWWEPGRNGNGPAPGRGEGYITSMAADGWMQVPHNIAGMVAFGEKRRIGGDVVSTVLNVFRVHRSANARTSEQHHTSAWVRPQQYGRIVHWEHDAEGELASRIVIAKTVLNMDPEKLPPAILRAAAAPVVRAIEHQLARQSSPIRDREVKRLYAQLPAAMRTTIDIGPLGFEE